MNASTGDRKTSGFSVPIENKSDISFNYHRISRLDSSGSVLSRPRLAKVRRHLGSDYPRSSPHPTDSRVNIDFNPFQTVCGNTNLISSGSEMSVSIEAKMADCDGKWDSSRKLEKEMADGMRKLRIESRKGVVNATDGGLRVNSYAGDKGVFIFESGSGKSSKDEGRELLNELKKLSIGNTDMNLGLNDENHGEKVGNSFAQSVNTEISNEYKELNIKGPTAVQGSDNLIFSANVLRNDAFKNPKKGTNSSVESLADTLPEQMMNLNMKEPSSGNKFVKNTARRTETLLSHRMKNVKIGRGKKNHDNQTDTCVFYPRFSSNEIDNEISNVKLYEKSISPTRSFQVSEGKDFSGSQVNLDGSHVNTKSASSVPSSGTQFRLSDNVSVWNSRDGPEGKYDLGFGSKENESESVNIEFNPHNPIFSGLNEQIEFSARREALNSTKSKKKRGKSAQPIKLWFSQDFVRTRHISEENQESPVSYSPMDMSPYSETSGNLQSPRGTCAVPPNPLDSVQGIDSHPEASNDAIEEGLVYATKLLNINKFDVKYAESGQGHFDSYSDKNVGIGNFAEESVSGTETESFKSAIDDLDVDDDNTVTTEATVSGSALNLERQEGDSWTHCNFSSSSEDAGKTTFTFSASSSPVQVKSPSQSRFTRRKNLKAGSILYNSTPDLNVPNVLSPMEFHSVSAPSFLSPQQSQDRDSFLQHNSGTTKDKKTEKESVFSQEACEEWRLRGNKAYAQGDLSIAEDYYTHGIICISRCETSRSCLRALMLCYSNRAATRISLGRIKEALEDCMVATAIDPNFLKVQVRAANCYLSLGEVEEATQCYKRCLQSGRDVCFDKKVLMEASEGLQRAQKVSDCMNRFAEFMRQKRPSDAECALEIISEALVISSNSEKLLEMKAEALLVMRKYEEVIQLCEESLSSVEKNFINLNVDNQITILDSTVLLKRFSFRIWRCRLVFMSLYHLGKLEEALHLLEKQDWCPVEWEGSRTLESLLPLASTVRDLLCHKSAGNEAFQSGQFAEAVEHYTSALTCNVESRPFAAVCFCNRAAAYKALGQISDAIADCSLAMALDRNYVKAISRRSILFAMIRDYGQATSDLQRLVSVLVNQLEDKTNQLGLSNRSTYSSNDLRQAQLQLSEMEEEAKKQTPLNMYRILGVEPSVSASEIKKAYRKAALKHHPDKASQSLPRCDNGDDALWKEIVEEVREDAEKLFKMIGEAYAVLSEPMKRAEYDLGEEMRNDRKRSNANNSSGTRADSPCDPFERNRSRTQWRDIYRSYGYSHSRASEANRTYRYSGL